MSHALDAPTARSEHRTDGPSLRPRVYDVSEAPYDEVARDLAGTDRPAYFERKGTETVLVVP